MQRVAGICGYVSELDIRNEVSVIDMEEIELRLKSLMFENFLRFFFFFFSIFSMSPLRGEEPS